MLNAVQRRLDQFTLGFEGVNRRVFLKGVRTRSLETIKQPAALLQEVIPINIVPCRNCESEQDSSHGGMNSRLEHRGPNANSEHCVNGRFADTQKIQPER